MLRAIHHAYECTGCDSKQASFSRSNSFKIDGVISQAVLYTKVRSSGYIMLKLMYNMVKYTLSQIRRPAYVTIDVPAGVF